MAKSKKEEVVEQTPQNQQKESTPVEDKIKIKKPSFKKNTDEITKVDLREVNKSEEDVINKEEVLSNQSDKNVVEQTSDEPETLVEETTNAKSEDGEKSEEQVSKDEQNSVLEEITDEEVEEQVGDLKEDIKDAIEESKQENVKLPDNIQKVIDFMDETGGSLDDYVKLNKDYSSLDQLQLLKEYYKSTKPHLADDEIDFLMEDNFSYDEEIDDERDIKRKKLALKEQVASAKGHLDGLKSKYYEEIKAGSKLTLEQQKAVNFFDRYNKESEDSSQLAEKQKSRFQQKTNEVFSDKFKGFEYNVGDKKYRFNVKDADKVKSTQSDINNFVRKFLNDKNEMSDAKGYHKSLFTAMNSDAIANHFYEQGKADAIKQSITKAKNIDMDPRQGHEGFMQAGGVKVRALDTNSSNDFKFKLKK